MKQRPEELDKLVEIAKIQSTEASNAIEGIVTTSTRIRQLVEEKTTPKNRDEQEIAGYRDVLNVIHDSFDAIPITKNYILQLHKMLYSHMNNPLAGQTKNVQNYISATYPDGHVEVLFTPLAPFETQEALDRICEEYNRVIGNMELEPLIAIPVFIHDFLCIHPFNDGNGRMSRLLTTLLLYRSGFYVGKYVSLEAKIAKNKDLYYEALAAAQPGWHDSWCFGNMTWLSPVVYTGVGICGLYLISVYGRISDHAAGTGIRTKSLIYAEKGGCEGFLFCRFEGQKQILRPSCMVLGPWIRKEKIAGCFWCSFYMHSSSGE